jgi:hypothetical protein
MAMHSFLSALRISISHQRSEEQAEAANAQLVVQRLERLLGQPKEQERPLLQDPGQWLPQKNAVP